jgi:hypothetical protein
VRTDLYSEEAEAAESARVRRWRFDQLVAAGYAAPDASAMARDPRVDLDVARRLVQRLGCPAELAARILT